MLINHPTNYITTPHGRENHCGFLEIVGRIGYAFWFWTFIYAFLFAISLVWFWTFSYHCSIAWWLLLLLCICIELDCLTFIEFRFEVLELLSSPVVKWWELHAVRKWDWRKVLGLLKKIRYSSITFNFMAMETGEHFPNKPVISYI